MEDGGPEMMMVREKVVTKLMVGIIQRIVMMMIGIQMMMVMIMIIGGWGWKVTSEEAVAVQQRLGGPLLSG